MAGFSFSNPGYVALLGGGEKVPAGWLGPVAPIAQDCLYINEGGMATPGGWGGAGGQPRPPGGSDHLIYFIGPGGQLGTTGYAGGMVRLYAPGGAGTGRVRLRVTRATTGEVLYDQAVLENQTDGSPSLLLHEVNLPVFAAWRLDIENLDNSVNLSDIIWL
jgi:hypothetical protein